MSNGHGHEVSEDLERFQKNVQQYASSRTMSGRVSFWEGLSDAERDELLNAGLPSPLTGDPLPDHTHRAMTEPFEAVRPEHDRFAEMTREAANEFRRGISDVHSGRLPVAPLVAQELEEILERTAGLPDDRVSEDLQRAARLIDAARADARSFDTRPSSGYREDPGPDGDVIVSEGRSRQRVTPDAMQEIEAAANETEERRERPWLGRDAVSLAELAAYTPDVLMRFKEEQPGAFQALMEAGTTAAAVDYQGGE